jgi:multidrug efflux system outer membrane protein
MSALVGQTRVDRRAVGFTRAMTMRALVAGVLATGFAGCMVGPKYHQPQTKIDPAFANAASTATSAAAGNAPASAGASGNVSGGAGAGTVGAAGVSAATSYTSSEPVAAFWTVFNDPLLTRLVTESLVANHDVRMAMARLREARALRRESKFDQWPTTSVSAGYSATKSSKDSIPFPTTDAQRRIELFETGFDSSWELDFFGRVRHAVDARTAEADAAAYDLRGVQVSVSAEVARSYYELRTLQRQLQVAQQNADNQGQTLAITQTRLDAGRGTAFDTERARTQLESTRATLPSLDAAIAATMHRLGVLTGRSPTALVQDLSAAMSAVSTPASASAASSAGTTPAPAATTSASAAAAPATTSASASGAPVAVAATTSTAAVSPSTSTSASAAALLLQPNLPSSIDVGSPETLLRRRPDIQSAERRLAAQTALVGVAVGDLFPKVVFNAGVGRSGETPASLVSTGGASYFIGPSITWPAFNIGRVRARIRASEARTDEALARYEQTVLVAIEEVETSLVAFDRARVRRERLLDAAQASERAADLARVRFEGGLSDFLQVLDAERTRLESQELVAQSLGETTSSLVAVYKALGGGWTAQSSAPPAP